MNDDLAVRLARMEMAEAARSLVAAYAMAADARDPEAAAALFTDDAVVAGSRRHEGRDAIFTYYRDAFGVTPCDHRHFITTVRVSELTADEAVVDAYFIHVTASAGTSILGWGRYHDRVRLVDGRALFAEKHIAMDHTGPLDKGWADAMAVAVSTR